jgi:hypothetical protein
VNELGSRIIKVEFHRGETAAVFNDFVTHEHDLDT